MLSKIGKTWNSLLIFIQFRYLATITVDNIQYKTYPQTYSTKEEAEEALSDLVIKKLG